MSIINISAMIIYLTILVNDTVNGATTSGEELIRHLLADTYPASIPKVHLNDVVEVTFSLQLIQIVELDDRRQLFTSKYWVKQSWYNALMTWNTTQWDGIEVS